MNTHSNLVNNHLTVGALDKNQQARQQQRYLNQVEAGWMLDHRPTLRQPPAWMRDLVVQAQAFLAVFDRQLVAAGRK